jgi:hypothetical protein
MLHAMLERYDLPPETLELAHSVQDWCRTRGVPEDNPFRAAKCFSTAEQCCIVMQAELSSSMVASAKSHMEFCGFEAQVAELNTDARYLAHLMLHEIASFKLQSVEQEARDAWAFKELARHVA